MTEDLGRRWDHAYLEGWAPWDIGRPQPAFQELLRQGELASPALDSGCGTGEHALMLAAAGFDVVGVDVSSAAIARAQAKARERRLAPRFVVGSVLTLERLGVAFKSVIDSGLFHTLDDADRGAYVASLRAVVVAGGTVNLMCFSELEPGRDGPRRVTQGEIRDAFSDGWRVERIDSARFEVRSDFSQPPRAWLARIVREEAG